MPTVSDSEAVLRLNHVRTVARAAELKAVAAFVYEDGRMEREDILQGLNRMSSMLYILMIQAKKGI
jgi:ethanolamine utilization cobalamin adenosyltransferase